MSGINDPLNWNLKLRNQYSALQFPDGTSKIKRISIPCESHLLQFGFRNDIAPSRWWLAANISMSLLTLPSSTSQFMVGVEAYRFRARLNALNMVHFPNYGLLPFLAEIDIPYWHKEMFIEIWQYDGPEFGVQSLDRIEKKIDDISDFVQ